jgi:hypothetical protein
MAGDPVALLRSVAKQFGRSVRTICHFDFNVCMSPRHPDRPWEILPLPGDMFRHKVAIDFGGHKVRLLANGEFVVVEIRCDLEVDVVSINRRDRIFCLKRSTFEAAGFPSLPIFADSTGDSLRRFLASPSLTQVLNALRLEESESLHIYGNGANLYFKPESVDEVVLAIKALCSFMDKLPTVGDSVNLDELPPKFEDIFSLIREWAVADDELRTEMLEQKSEAALRKFVSAVEPHIPAINEYLDSFGEKALPEAATALGALAECATEASIILDRAKS